MIKYTVLTNAVECTNEWSVKRLNIYCRIENPPLDFYLNFSSPKRRTSSRTLHMSPNAAQTGMTDTSGDIATATTPASLADVQEAIPGLLDDIIVTHILRTEHFDDPADLARLPAVSRAMRDAVAVTGLGFEELGENDAVELGCVSALQRRQRRGLLSRQEYLCEAAARSGHLEKLQALRADGWPWDAFTCAGAARGGQLEVMQWARANGCPWNTFTCYCAARGGHLEVLQWARANDCPWRVDTCVYTAQNGHLEVLQWARANGCPWDERTCSMAAMAGHLEVLQWARTNGCPWDKRTCFGAACGGHFEVLQWARANGCPWDERTCHNAAMGGHLEVLQWARANGCKWNEETCSGVALGGNLELLQWARANGCEWIWDRCEAEAKANQHENVLAWLHKNKPTEP